MDGSITERGDLVGIVRPLDGCSKCQESAMPSTDRHAKVQLGGRDTSSARDAPGFATNDWY